jgi:hypothetical protein
MRILSLAIALVFVLATGAIAAYQPPDVGGPSRSVGAGTR